MLTFKRFLTEKFKFPTVKDMGNAVYTIKKHPEALEAVKNGTVLYRAMKTNVGDVVMIDATGSIRHSLSTNNVYQIMMDNSSALSNFPNRTESIICSTSFNSITSYGSNYYVVIPIDDQGIAVSSKDDFLNQKVVIPGTSVSIYVDALGLYLAKLFSKNGLEPDEGKSYIDIDRIDNWLSSTAANFTDQQWERIYTSIRNSNSYVANEQFATYDFLRAFMKKHKSNPLSEMSNAIMTPKNLELKLVSPGNKTVFNPSLPVEVWFSGKALMINTSIFKNALEDLMDEGYKVDEQLIDYLEKRIR